MTAQPAPPENTSRSRRRRLSLLAAVIVLPLAAIGVAYLLFFTDDSPERLRLSNPGATVTTTQGLELDGVWSIAPGSTAGYRVRERLARLPAQSDAVGRTDAVTGSFTLSRTDQGLTVAPGAQFSVDVSRLRSDEERRDNRIRTMGLETDRYPTATFVTTDAIVLAAVAGSGVTRAQAVGDLTIHGVTRRVTIPLEAQRTGDQVEVVGSLTFPFSDFEMSPPNIAGFVTVEPNATLEFRLLFRRQ